MVSIKSMLSPLGSLAVSWLNDPSQVKVTIIIAAFSNLHRLPATLESLRLQTHPNIECLLLVSEESSAFLTALDQNKYPFEITSYPFYAPTPAEAYNRAVALAHGQYVQLLHAGDVYLSSFALEKMVHLALENFIPDLVYMGTLRQRENKEAAAVFEAYSRENLQRGVIPTTLCGCLLFKESFLASGRFDPRVSHLYDFDWFCRMLQQPTFQFVCEDFFPIEKAPRQLLAKERLQALSQMRRLLYRHYGPLVAFIGWWAQRPFHQFSNWLRRKNHAETHRYSWRLVSSK